MSSEQATASEAPATQPTAAATSPAATPAPAAAAGGAASEQTTATSTTTTAEGQQQQQQQQSAQAASQQQQPSPSTSLYVGELDPTVTEAMLYEIFSMIGPVASIRVCRDAVTRRSLGYAYVNYLNSADGERALDSLNYSLIKNRPCRIMWSQRDPSLRKTGAGNIFIKNLDANIDNKALHDTFAAFGNILSCKVAVGPQGQSLGYGFVHYDTAEAAHAAIENVNGMLLNDKVVFVGLHIPKRERQAKIDEIRSHYTNLYVKNVPLEVTQDEFKELFEKYGPVTSAVISTEDDGKSKGFGFVNYEKHDDAAKAVAELHDKDFKGSQLYVARAQRKGEREEELRKVYEQKKMETTLKYQGVNLYVKNLDDDITEEKLRSEFEPFGQITSCKIMSDDKGASKGFGFVCFSSPDEATKAVTELNGKMLGAKPLYVALAQRKDVRKQQLEAQVAQRNQIRSQQMQAAGIPGIGGPYPGMPGAAPMYYGAPAGYPGQPGGRGGPMGYPQGGPGMPRPRFYAPNMPGMPPQMAPYGGQMPPAQYGQYPPQQGGPRGGPRGQVPAPVPGGPNGLPGRPMVAGGQQPPTMPNGAQAGRPAVIPPPQGAQQPPQAAGQQPQQRGPPQSRPQGAKQPAQEEGLTAARLANLDPSAQKQLLGEALYPKIHATQPDLAGKITGMLLEMDSSELLYLIENDEALTSKVEEALEVLDDFAKRQQAEGGAPASSSSAAPETAGATAEAASTNGN